MSIKVQPLNHRFKQQSIWKYIWSIASASFITDIDYIQTTNLKISPHSHQSFSSPKVIPWFEEPLKIPIPSPFKYIFEHSTTLRWTRQRHAHLCSSGWLSLLSLVMWLTSGDGGSWLSLLALVVGLTGLDFLDVLVVLIVIILLHISGGHSGCLGLLSLVVGLTGSDGSSWLSLLALVVGLTSLDFLDVLVVIVLLHISGGYGSWLGLLSLVVGLTSGDGGSWLGLLALVVGFTSLDFLDVLVVVILLHISGGHCSCLGLLSLVVWLTGGNGGSCLGLLSLVVWLTGSDGGSWLGLLALVVGRTSLDFLDVLVVLVVVILLHISGGHSGCLGLLSLVMGLTGSDGRSGLGLLALVVWLAVLKLGDWLAGLYELTGYNGPRSCNIGSTTLLSSPLIYGLVYWVWCVITYDMSLGKVLSHNRVMSRNERSKDQQAESQELRRMHNEWSKRKD
jgi:hypothetical protein